MAGRMGIRVSQAKQLGRRRRESGLEAALFEALAGCSQKFLLALFLLGPAARMFAISSRKKFFGPALRNGTSERRPGLACAPWPEAAKAAVPHSEVHQLLFMPSHLTSPPHLPSDIARRIAYLGLFLVHHQRLPCRSSLSHPLSTGSAKIYLMQSP
ncbi:hypothetical protein L1887_49193 [Cichorium endivia]|nr:hypothetical protein L1887_49193 [Cichorium endivia]